MPEDPACVEVLYIASTNVVIVNHGSSQLLRLQLVMVDNASVTRGAANVEDSTLSRRARSLTRTGTRVQNHQYIVAGNDHEAAQLHSTEME